jgi:hypothetical protein
MPIKSVRVLDHKVKNIPDACARDFDELVAFGRDNRAPLAPSAVWLSDAVKDATIMHDGDVEVIACGCT